MLTRREAIIGTITASLKYDEAGLFAEHPTDAERIARLADDFAQVWAAKAVEARAAVETPDHLGDLGIVNVRVYGAAGDGVTDDTAAIQAAIAAMSAGDTLYFPRGTYRRSGNTSLAKAMTVLAYGAAFTGGGLYVSAEGVSVYGATVDDAPAYGIYSRRSRTKVVDCTVTDSLNIGIFIETNATTGADIRDCEIRGCTVDRTGIAAADIDEGGIKVHGHSSGPYQVIGTRISNNVVRMPDDPTDGAAICIEVWGGCPHSVITGNSTFGGEMGVSVDKSDYTAVSGNAAYQPQSIGYENAGSIGVAFTGNTLYGPTAKGIVCSNTNPDNTVITGNVLHGVTSRSVQVQAAENVTVAGNTIISGGGYGVEITGSDGATVSGNTLTGAGNGSKAVVVDESSSVAIVGNLMKDWTQHGVLLYGNDAVTLNKITIQGNVFDNCNVSYGTQFSGGAALGGNEYIEVYGVAQ